MRTTRFPASTALLRIAALLLAIFILSPAASAELRQGEKSFGPKIGYTGKNKSALGGLVFQYSLSRRVRLAPEASIIFRNHDLDALDVSLNVHIPFGFENDKVALYPLAGLTYQSWAMHGIESDKDVTTHSNHFGANVGGGVELRCTQTLKLTLEGRYSFVKDFGSAQVAAGISFVF